MNRKLKIGDLTVVEKRILLVIPPVNFRDEEFLEPYTHFTQDHQWDVTVASTTTGTATGMLGQTWDVKQTITEQQADGFDALVVVGGMGSPEHLWSNEPLLQLVRDFNDKGKVVSSICLSGAVLAKAGVLEGRKATVWEMPESLAEFEKGKAQFIRQDLVVDGNIITSNGPHAATAFAKEIANHLLQVPAR
jgi:protease I